MQLRTCTLILFGILSACILFQPDLAHVRVCFFQDMKTELSEEMQLKTEENVALREDSREK